VRRETVKKYVNEVLLFENVNKKSRGSEGQIKKESVTEKRKKVQ
jgi:hypothetical protein